MGSSSNNVYPEPPPPYNPNLDSSLSNKPTAETFQKGALNYQPCTENPNYMPPDTTGAQPAYGPPTAATIIVGVPVYGTTPTTVTCPNCHQTVVSVVTYRPGLLTWLLVGGLALFGLWCGCCLIPLCVNNCQDVEHSCPNCRGLLGTYKRI